MTMLWQGYISGRPVNGNLIPQRVQNLVLRDYAQRQHLSLEFSAAEYRMKNCYMILHGLMESLEDYSGLIFYSIHMLPDDAEERRTLLRKIVVGKKEIHFALENLVVSSNEDIEFFDVIFLAKTLSSDSYIKEPNTQVSL